MDLKQAEKLAHELMDEHGVTADGWRFKFDNARRRFGLCSYTRRTISLSRYLVELNGEPDVRNSILHEIAHALAGPYAKHGAEWRRVARSIGCTASRCHTAQTVAPKYTGICPSCSREIKRHRRNALACGKCCRLHNGGEFDEKYLFNWQ